MRVFVAGATGVLGSGLVRDLVALGFDVVGLSRGDGNDASLVALGARPARGDLFDPESLARAAVGSEVVVRAATHVPKGEWSEAEVALMARVRRDGTRALLDAAGRVGARAYVQESVLWPDDAARDAEAAAARSGIASTTLRFGWFYGSRSAHTRGIVDALVAGRLIVPTDGAARKSMIHVEDAARAMAQAVVKRPPGVWEVVDDEPTPLATLLDLLADAVGAPRPARGAPPSPFLSMESVGDAGPFRRTTGWTPRYGLVRDGAREVAAGLPSAT